MTKEDTNTEATPLDFIRSIVAEDIASGKHDKHIATRFPPEPNGYLHIGHAKAICLDFGIAKENNAECHLRFDDTNPDKESVEYADAIKDDIHWLGFDWGEHLYNASDYFEQMYNYAVQLIESGKAYICDLTPDEFRECRGVPTRPGKESPFRNRSIEENLELFKGMRDDKYPDGQYVLRAKIDMTSPNLHMRDPALYRIKHGHHYRTGDKWCIYPTYDFAHCIEDSIEKITHSLCTLEFEVHRPLYDWILEQLDIYRSRQIEFAPLNLSYTVMSKRMFRELVEDNSLSGWDDPRIPTIKGLRRRGYTPEAIRAFCDKIGITKVQSLTDVALLEHCLREDLNKTSARVMGVVDPLKVIIDNYPENESEEFEALNNPNNPDAGTRMVPFSREIYIERADFMEEPVKKFFRLSPEGREVRLRNACYITCTHAIKDEATGEVTEIHCTFDPESRGASTPDGRKVKGTIHWVSVAHALEVKVNLYDRLFSKEDMSALAEGEDFKDHLNKESLKTITAFVEPSLADAELCARYQFERIGYFCIDTVDSTQGNPVFNRTVTLRDSWGKKKG